MTRTMAHFQDPKLDMQVRELIKGINAAETPEGAQAKVDAHANRTDNPHLVTAAQAGAIPSGEKGQPNGVATLDSTGKMPDSQIPDGITRDTELAAHTGRTDNPHQVTATQVGAVPVTGGTMTGELTFGSDNIGIITYAGGCFYKKAGTGIVIKRASNEIDPQVENYTGTALWKLWHAGNDGAGSGMDSDMLDGYHKDDLVPTISRWVQPGDTILLEALTYRYTNSTSEVLVKQFRVVRPGCYRITGEMSTNNTGGTAYLYVRLASSGLTVGSFSTTSISYVPFTIDMTYPAAPLDAINLYYKTSSGYSAKIQNVRLRYADNGPEPSPIVTVN